MNLREQPEFCCNGCGNEYGNGRTTDTSTMHLGKCGVCGRTAVVTEPRDYGYLTPDWRDHGKDDRRADTKAI